MRLEKVEAGREDGRVTKPRANPIGGQAGEPEEPLGASFVG